MFKTRKLNEEFQTQRIVLEGTEVVFTPWSNMDLQNIEKFKNALKNGNYKEMVELIQEAIKDPEANKIHWLELTKRTGLFFQNKREFVLSGQLFVLRAENYPPQSTAIIEVAYAKALEVYKKGAIYSTDNTVRKECNEEGQKIAKEIGDEDSLEILISEPIDYEIKQDNELIFMLKELDERVAHNRENNIYDKELEDRARRFRIFLETEDF